jgi:phosphogluconate dehydratase
MTHPTVEKVTARIRARSRKPRGDYLDRAQRAAEAGPRRAALSCGNLAHAIAACGTHDKTLLAEGSAGNVGIVTAYNDMLSAHQPYERFPELIRAAARDAGGTAQVAGGVPAMCDGVTQGQAGMELSLFSRDVIALAAGVALSHNSFDAAVFLGICDKIVPGLVIAAASFGHLPIAMYTINGAYQTHQERDTGSIEVGKLADLVVLEQNLFAVAPREIHRVRVVRTILEGKTVYARGSR